VEALDFQSIKESLEEEETLYMEHPMKNCNHETEWLH
jgi:hypothetical protein